MSDIIRTMIGALSSSEVAELQELLDERKRVLQANAPGALTSDEWNMINGTKPNMGIISCIKSVRTRLNMSLMDAKDYVDNCKKYGPKP